jgi:hypothetical protein
VVVGLVALAIWFAQRPTASPSTIEQIYAANDVGTASAPMPGGGDATIVYSQEINRGVVVMKDVSPPESGTVYQMWLVTAGGPISGGTLDAAAVKSSTAFELNDLRHATALDFTVEPGFGSAQPTGRVIAALPLT